MKRLTLKLFTTLFLLMASCVVAYGQFVYDTFTGMDGVDLTSHSGETGATWIKYSAYGGTINLSNANRIRSYDNSLYYASGSPASAEYDVQADFVLVGGTPGYYGIVGRFDPATGYGYRVYWDAGAQTLYLQKNTATTGGLTPLASYAPSTPLVGSTHTIKLEIRNAAKKVYYDGVVVMTSTDSELTGAGKAGVYAGGTNTNTSGWNLDNFSASNPAQSSQDPSDDFNDNSRGAIWSLGSMIQATATDPLVTVAETSGQLQITPRASVSGDHYNGYLTAASYDLRGASISVQVVQSAINGKLTQAYFAIGTDANNWIGFSNNGEYFTINSVVGGAATNVRNILINNSQQAYWRIRHSLQDDKIYFETSPNGTTNSWVIQAAYPRPFSLASCKLELSAGSYGSVATPSAVIFDNLITTYSAVGVVIDRPNPPQRPNLSDAERNIRLSTTSSITLNSTGSFTRSNRTIAGYSWSQVSGPNTATLTGASTATLTVTNFIAGSYVFRLTITDSAGNSASDTITVRIWGMPTVSTGGPYTASAGQAFVFNASGSTEVYNHTFTDGTSPVSWNFGDPSTVEFIKGAHMYPLPGTYPVSVTVKNYFGESATGNTTVTIAAIPTPKTGHIVRTLTDTGNPATNASNLQAQIDAASLGDVIEIPPSFVSDPIILRNKVTGTDWITIRSTQYLSLPSTGNRITAASASLMPTIRAAVSGTGGAVNCEAGAHHYNFVGVQFTINQSNTSIIYNLITVGTTTESSTSQLCHDIIFDRIYAWLPSSSTYQMRRAFYLGGNTTTVMNSRIEGIKTTIAGEGSDSQAIAILGGQGVDAIYNNDLEAATENILTGGSANTLSLLPSDVDIRRNHFYKRWDWYNGPSSASYTPSPVYAGTRVPVKNLLELKQGRRFVVSDNLFENCWAETDQRGQAIILNIETQNDTIPDADTDDIQFSNNVVRHAAGGIGSSATSASGTLNTNHLSNVIVRNNLFTDIAHTYVSYFSGQTTSGLFTTISRNEEDYTYTHNTVINDGYALSLTGTEQGINVKFINNMVQTGGEGVRGDNVQEGINTLLSYLFTYTLKANVFSTVNSSLYPNGATDNSFPTSSAFTGSFVSYANRDYHLVTGSSYKNGGTDGKDTGADIDALITSLGSPNSTFTAGTTKVETGQWMLGQFVFDTFTGMDGAELSTHAGETGATWANVTVGSSGSMYISNANRLRSYDHSLYCASGLPASAEYDVQADFVLVGSSPGYAGIAGRIDPATGYHYRVYWDAGAQTLYLQKNSATSGGTSILASYLPGTPASGSTHTIKLEIRNATKKVYYDGVLVMTSTDNELTGAGKAGIYFGGTNTSTSGWNLDNFSASNP